MPTTQIDRDATAILRVLAEAPRDKYVERDEVGRLSGLSPERINDAVALLVESGYAEWMQTFGTAPYDFNAVTVTSRGRYEWQRLAASGEEASKGHIPSPEPTGQSTSAESDSATVDTSSLPPSPMGSPYGFTDEDWETVSGRREHAERLYVVLGHQFDSKHFETDALRLNVEAMMQRAVDDYNGTRERPTLELKCRTLSAGYGEHLFNEIARDIIGSDIAIFETSDLNPNVMLEMGVALTWGIRVLPIKVEGRPKPPSDVSGQTWADYRDDAAVFVDPDHERKLVRMIERAVRKKRRGTV